MLLIWLGAGGVVERGTRSSQGLRSPPRSSEWFHHRSARSSVCLSALGIQSVCTRVAPVLMKEDKLDLISRGKREREIEVYAFYQHL